MAQDLGRSLARVAAGDMKQEAGLEASRGGSSLDANGGDHPGLRHVQPDDQTVPRGRLAKGFITSGGLLAALDERLGDGIPLGSLTLVEGSPRTGKSVLCQHFAYGALTGGASVAYITSEHTVKSLVAQMSSMDLGVTDYLGAERLGVFPLRRPESSEDTSSLLSELALDIDRLSARYKVIILDELTDFGRHCQQEETEGFFTACRKLQETGRAIITAASSSAFDETVLDRLSSLCDIHISLRGAKLGTMFVNTLEIVKGQNQELEGASMFRLDVQPRFGMQLFPIQKDRA